MQWKILYIIGKITTNFHNNKVPREGSQLIFLSVILIDPAFRTGKNYYPQVLLEECKYVAKRKKKIPQYIINNIKTSSDSERENSDNENSDNETSDEKISDEENFNK